MPRIRTIKPEFWSDERVAGLAWFTRLVFIATWTFADDEGRGYAIAKQFNGNAFALDDVADSMVEEAFYCLAASGMIVLYHPDGFPRLYAIPSWKNHQVISHPTPSKLPPPPAQKEPRGAASEPIRNSSGTAPEALQNHSRTEVGSRKWEVGSRKKEVGDDDDSPLPPAQPSAPATETASSSSSLSSFTPVPILHADDTAPDDDAEAVRVAVAALVAGGEVREEVDAIVAQARANGRQVSNWRSYLASALRRQHAEQAAGGNGATTARASPLAPRLDYAAQCSQAAIRAAMAGREGTGNA